MAILGAIGFVMGAAFGALFAHHMGYDWAMALKIGGLLGITGWAGGTMIPPLTRALGWGLLAASLGGVGAGALWLVTRIAPALVERVIR